jgi:hypothetical protein
MKETFYFSHDYNATSDPRIMELLSDCGLAGVGIYWILVEILHQQETSLISKNSFQKYIKFYANFENRGDHFLQKLEKSLLDSELFEEDSNGNIFSKRVLKNKEFRENEKKKKSEAGRIGGKKTAELKQCSSNAQATLKQNEAKERKGKERKVNNIFTSEVVYQSEKISDEIAIAPTPTPKQEADIFFSSEEQQNAVALYLSENLGGDLNFFKKEIKKFVGYWTEPTPSGKRKKWETEKTFLVKLRLTNWISRIKNFKEPPKTTKHPLNFDFLPRK